MEIIKQIYISKLIACYQNRKHASKYVGYQTYILILNFFTNKKY